MWRTMLLLAAMCAAGRAGGKDCVARRFGHGSAVCVCNATYCDTAGGGLGRLPPGAARRFASTKDGGRLVASVSRFYATPHVARVRRKPVAGAAFKVNQRQRYQQIIGFGGAATDAATINTYSLSARTSEQLIRAYFGEEGIGYTLIRVPVGSSDFSAHYYGYTDDYPEDTSLRHFNLSREDFEYKIPFISRAKQVSPSPLKLISTPWSAPDWMKVINPKTNVNWLRKDLYKVYANLYLKFLEGYAAKGLRFWGLTPQNEPSEGLATGKFNKMGWTTDDMVSFLVRDLCPLLKEKGHGGVKVMINDDQRRDVAEWLKTYSDKELYECAAGMAVHWYKDQETPAAILSKAHHLYPEKFLLYTEACFEHEKKDPAVTLGKWEKGALYMADIIEVINNWVTGWMNWNLALDADGGPNWADNTVDSPIIVNATADEFYKQPMFYAIAHFSKFVPPGSVRVGLELQWGGGIEGVAFLTPANVTVLVLQNRQDTSSLTSISDPVRGTMYLKLEANSMNTVLYR
ncbi:lysosomal acid glucosylceramidase-like [Bacillus rossius redtenbacheri]|uniref:lysosomal acid glucosylceramidase-like n=1 Tax=Bacillus rossius redtenbacheri TaxID=93214 RepID=UPI002FDD3C7E